MGDAHHGSVGQKTVLLVEDEESLRNLLRLILIQQGYRVLEGVDGEQGLSVARQYGGPIHLLVANASLPRLNGYQLAQRLRPGHPEMRTLYVSGYLTGDLVELCQADPGCLFLQKPFTPAQLIAKIHDALCSGRVAGGGAG